MAGIYTHHLVCDFFQNSKVVPLSPFQNKTSLSVSATRKMRITIPSRSPNPLDLNCRLETLISDEQYTKFSVSPCNSDPFNNSSPTFSLSPCSQDSPCVESPWATRKDVPTKHGLIGTLIREDGHVYSISAARDLLYTGSDSKNIRVWKNMEEFSAFKSSSGLVKAIVVSGEKIFTGHQDGRIRVWRLQKNSYVPVGNLPKSQDLFVKSMNPKNYVQVRRRRNVPWIRHYDAVSCLTIDADNGLLYSGSWDKTLKVWRISDSKCLESIKAHDDAVNSVAAGFGGEVFTGSADGTMKAWRRTTAGHVLVETMLKQVHAVTSLAASGGVLYAGCSDGLVFFWERGEGDCLSYGGVLRGHKLAVLCVAAEGRLVLSGSADKSICVWRRNAGGNHECLTVLTGHEGPVKCLAVAEDDGDWIVYSGSLDKSVRIWRLSEHAQKLN